MEWELLSNENLLSINSVIIAYIIFFIIATIGVKQ